MINRALNRIAPSAARAAGLTRTLPTKGVQSRFLAAAAAPAAKKAKAPAATPAASASETGSSSALEKLGMNLDTEIAYEKENYSPDSAAGAAATP